MDLSTWALILFAISFIALVGELFLPSGGVLGILSGGAMVACIIVCFRINQYLGLAVLIAAVIATPFACSLGIRIWQKSPFGRRMILQPTLSPVQPPVVPIGATGTTLSELRPMGTCQFDDLRVEVRSELGIIPSGSKVKVVNIDGGRLVVRKA